MILGIFKRFVGAVGGIVAGVLLVIIIRTSLDFGITILPIGTLLWQLSPGILLGGIAGALFPRIFAWVTFFLPTN